MIHQIGAVTVHEMSKAAAVAFFEPINLELPAEGMRRVPQQPARLIRCYSCWVRQPPASAVKSCQGKLQCTLAARAMASEI